MSPVIPAISHRLPRQWTRVTLAVGPAMAEAAAALLGTLSGAGVEIAAADQAGDHGDSVVRIIGYLPPPAAENAESAEPAADLAWLATALLELWAAIPQDPRPEIETETIIEEDWGSTWKKFFTPLAITPRLTIKPSWEEYAARPGELVIEMDPGLAFGTGHHASTSLALNLLDDFFLGAEIPGARVLDVGTGTGILAMACALFGAGPVLALDNDPDAVAAAGDNVARNGLAAQISCSAQGVQDLAGPFELIVANITHDVLSAMAVELVGLLASPGCLVLAGILKGDQEESIKGIYTGLGLELLEQAGQDEWVALRFGRG